jgi:hypothetical protein
MLMARDGQGLACSKLHRIVVGVDVAGDDAVPNGELLDVVRTGVHLVGRPAVGSEILIHDVCRPPMAVIIGARACVPETV